MGRRKMDPVRATDRLLVDNRPHWSPQEEAYHYTQESSSRSSSTSNHNTTTNKGSTTIPLTSTTSTSTLKQSSTASQEEGEREVQQQQQEARAFVPPPLPARLPLKPSTRRSLSMTAVDKYNYDDDIACREGCSPNQEEEPSSSETSGGRIRRGGPRRVRSQDERPHRVSFTKLEIHSFNVVLADHPYCSQGCSVSLGWDCVQSKSVDLQEYEDQRCPRRKLSDLRLTAQERHSLLLDESYNATELRRASRKLHRARSCVARIGGRMNQDFFKVCDDGGDGGP